MPKDSKKRRDELKALYVRVESLSDLVRCAVAERQTHIMAIKLAGGSYRLAAESDRSNGLRIFCYFDTEKIGSYVSYSTDYENGEQTEITNSVAGRQDHYKVYRLPIIEVASNPYLECKKEDLKGISVVEVKDHGALIKALINNMAEDENLPKIYSFSMGGSRFIGTFDIFPEQGRVFTYAKLQTKQRFRGLSYDYNNDRIEPTDSLSEAPKITVRAINLSEPFPLLKK